MFMASTLKARQCLFVGIAILIVGSAIGLNLYAEHKSIDAVERDRLIHQTIIVEKNLSQQLLAITSVVQRRLSSHANWNRSPDNIS